MTRRIYLKIYRSLRFSKPKSGEGLLESNLWCGRGIKANIKKRLLLWCSQCPPREHASLQPHRWGVLTQGEQMHCKTREVKTSEWRTDANPLPSAFCPAFSATFQCLRLPSAPTKAPQTPGSSLTNHWRVWWLSYQPAGGRSTSARWLLKCTPQALPTAHTPTPSISEESVMG